MWAFSPTLLVIVGTIACVMLLWGQIWFDKQNKTGEKYTCPIFLLFRGVFLTFMAFIGVFLLDGVIKLYFTDLLSYGSLKYIIATSILCTGLGILLIIGAVFIAPTWKTFLAFGIMLVAALYIDIASISDNSLEYTDFLLIPFSIGLGIELILTPSDLFYRVLSRKERSKISFKRLQEALSPPLWDKSPRFKKIFNTKAYLITFAVFVVELILLFEGLDYLIWL
jgi:hypothetical protein